MQENEGNIDLQLWEYIDGICTNAERERIALLIQQNDLWASTYKELLSFQQKLVAGNELQEPHMRFTQNIMDAIAGTKPMPAMRRYINRPLMRGIAAFLLVSICISVIVILSSINWNAPASVAMHLPPLDLSTAINTESFNAAINTQSINVAIGVLVVVGLVFLDHVLRMKRQWKRV